MTCSMCGSENMVLLGQLGSLYWLRCKACGIEESVHAEVYAELEAEYSGEQMEMI